jgi:WD40 repeat protein
VAYGHKEPVYSLKASSDPSVFFSASGDGIVARWNLENPETGHMVAKVQNSVYAIDYLAEQDLLAVGHNYDGLHIIEVESKKEIASIGFTKAAIFDIRFILSNIWVATGDGHLIVLDIDSRKRLADQKFSEERVRCMDFNPNENEVAVGYSDNHIRVFDATDFRLKKEFEAHGNSVFGMSYSPDKDYLLSVGRDAQIRVWDRKMDYKQVHHIPAHMYAINHLAFSPEGKHFVTCSMDKSIKVWDYEHMKLIKVIDKARHAGHGTSVNKLLWSDYHNQVISCSDDRTISVWNINILENI